MANQIPSRGFFPSLPFSPSENNLRLRAKTFVGVDFGTSTTVASVMRRDGSSWKAEVLQIEQPQPEGGALEDVLVNSVLAWKDGQLFFGQPANNMRWKAKKAIGKRIFASFKMGLGTDLGPTYPKSYLKRGTVSGVTVETAKDATVEFFKCLIPQIEKAVSKLGLSTDIEYSFSVPASFQAAQRRDYINALREAGINAGEENLLDEPNAAFLSYISLCARGLESADVLKALNQNGVNILIYDFGAGTCDISILTIRECPDNPEQLTVENRAISKFTALGGDNIDREIARQILLPQLLADTSGIEITESLKENTIIPALCPSAEILKLTANRWAEQAGLQTLSSLKSEFQRWETGREIAIKIQGEELKLTSPSMTSSQFASVMENFIGEWSEENPHHVFSPVADAMDKCGLDEDDLYAVLFIGGSSESPLVRRAVMDGFDSEIKAVIPQDLRSHVSQGAAIHALSLKGFGINIIQPITAEDICVIAKDSQLQTLIKASTEVPSSVFETKLKVSKDFQEKVVLPICLGNPKKIMGLLELRSLRLGFQKGAEIKIEGKITKDKLLLVKATCSGESVEAKLLNPLTTEELKDVDRPYLEAKKALNNAILKFGSSGVPKKIIEEMASACESTKRFLEAVDFYRHLDANFNEDCATNLCYCLSRCGKEAESNTWAKKAFDRKPNALTAYNMSCSVSDEKEREFFLRKALEFNPKYVFALSSLGLLLHSRHSPESVGYLRAASSELKNKLNSSSPDLTLAAKLIRISELLGDEETKKMAEEKKNEIEILSSKSSLYDEDSLAETVHAREIIQRRN